MRKPQAAQLKLAESPAVCFTAKEMPGLIPTMPKVRATVKVKRGSEQYRALIADEPAIRSIAEQLGGEVIVVWKGTAYRIR